MWSNESDTDMELVNWLAELHTGQPSYPPIDYIDVQPPRYPHVLHPAVQALDLTLPEDSLDDDQQRREAAAAAADRANCARGEHCMVDVDVCEVCGYLPPTK